MWSLSSQRETGGWAISIRPRPSIGPATSTPACITALPQPTVAGTRIRVATILACDHQGMTVEEIVQQLVPLKPPDVHDALASAYDHLDQIESDLASDDEAASDDETAVKRSHSPGCR